jgi:S-formylglutathione hydrolase FrmB
MSLCELRWHSAVLGQKLSMNVILPDAGRGPFPVFYLLHGLTDDHTVWVRRTNVERYVADLPLIVVMPDGHRGFYTDHVNGPAYGQHVAAEVPAFIERHFHAMTTREGRCVGGLSMGGYGALRLALAHPDRYASATSHSGAVGMGDRDTPRDGGPVSLAEFRRIFGLNPWGTNHDLLHLARQAKASPAPLPAVRMDCGTEDFLIEDNRALHRELTQIGVPHEYAEFPGAHNWDYWDQHVRDAIAFHARALGLRRAQ